MITFAAIFVVLVALALLSNAMRQTAALERMERWQHETPHPEIPPEIIALAQSGDLIGAIKAYRGLTGCSLEIAKARLDPFIAAASPPIAATTPPPAPGGAGQNIILFVVILVGSAIFAAIAVAVLD